MIKIQLIPASAQGLNLRKILKKEEWRHISRVVRFASDGYCEYCGEQYNPVELHAHEEWKFDKKRRRMRLKDIVGICPLCHEAVHIGRTRAVCGEAEFVKVANHYMLVNNCSYEQFGADLEKAYKKCKKRSDVKWKLDVSKKDVEKILARKQEAV